MADATQDSYAAELGREILRSETQRVQMLAAILAIILAVTTTMIVAFPGLSARLFQGGLVWYAPAKAVGPFVLYALFVWAILRYRASVDRGFPRAARFANALIETSLPSAIIYELSRHMDPETVFAFWPPLLYFVFILLSTLRLDFGLSVWTGAVAAIEQFLLVIWLIPLERFTGAPEHSFIFHISRSVILLGTGIVAGIVASSLRRQFAKSVAATAARDRVTNMFGQHVSPAVVDRLLASQSDPPSEMREVCVLFLDIRGFTAMTRLRSAGETVAMLNDFFAEMIDIVDRNHGIVNKFLGDGFLALFGAPLEDPDAAAHALAAGYGMLEAVERWNARRPEQPLRIGIGIHHGEAVTGTVGSPQRKEYTVIGETVNLASRIEQLTKETGSMLLVSSTVQSATEPLGAIDLGPLPVRGYDEGVRVWKVV
jgi:adenylate cyclase